MLWLFCSLSLAQEIFFSPEGEVVTESAQENLWILWDELTDEEHIEQVRELQRVGRYDAAVQRLLFIQQRQDSPVIQFEMARNTELMGEYATALELYTQLHQQELEEGLQLEVAFRRALVLSDVDRHKEAIRSLRQLRRRFSLSKDDKVVVNLALGTSELQAGKKWMGIRHIQRNLELLESGQQHPWIQARARYALAQELLDQAHSIALSPIKTGTKLNDKLQERANLILAAEKQIAVVIQLDEPEYALQGLIDIADAMLILYDDLVAVPPPTSFTPDQAVLFRERMAQDASVLQEKAFNYYSKGLRYAEQLDWPGDIQDELREKREIVGREKGL